MHQALPFALVICIDDQLSGRPAGRRRFRMRHRQNYLSTHSTVPRYVLHSVPREAAAKLLPATNPFLFSRISQKPFCDMWDVTARRVQSHWPDRRTRFAIYSQPITRRSQPMSLRLSDRSPTMLWNFIKTKIMPRRLCTRSPAPKRNLGNSFGTFPETVS